MTIGTINARFVGKTSLGFIKNLNYELEIYVDTNSRKWVLGRQELIDCNISVTEINPNYNMASCDYDRIDRFLEFWQVLNIIRIEPDSELNRFVIKKFKSSIREIKINILLEK